MFLRFKTIASVAICMTLASVITNSNAQGSYCNSSGESIQKVLDSRAGKTAKFNETVTTGVAYILAFECDSALFYFQAAYNITPDPTLKDIVSEMGGKVEERPAAEEPQPEKAENNASLNSSEPVTASEEQSSEEGSTASYSDENTSAASSSSSSVTKTFSASDLVAFQEKGLQKVKRLTEYLNIIAQKSTPASTAQTTIENAIVLFDKEDNTVEVSSVNRSSSSRYPIRTYFSRLRMLNYQKVTIQGASFTYVSTFRKGPDGNYYGIARFRQSFTGYRDNRPVYSDVTTKTVAVVLKPYQKAFEGESVENWDVFLGDISVIQTEK